MLSKIIVPKTFLYILISLCLFSFAFNLVVKCDGKGIINIECHSHDCNESKDSNQDCTHCLIINNTILVAQTSIVLNQPSEIFYFSDKSNYESRNINSSFRPPQA
jgi:hypothetical protein